VTHARLVHNVEVLARHLHAAGAALTAYDLQRLAESGRFESPERFRQKLRECSDGIESGMRLVEDLGGPNNLRMARLGAAVIRLSRKANPPN
jgi:hypothetical protein